MTWFSCGSTLEHPARAALNCVDEAVTALGEANLWALSDSELLDLRVAQERSVARLQARVLATTREIDSRGAAGKVGAPSTAAWLKGRVGVAPGAAKREVALARELDVDLPVLRDALATGELSLGHARVVADAIGALPGGVDAATRSRGETFLVREAATRNVAALGRIAAHLLRVLDPDGADRLEREEAEQEVSEEFTLVHRHDGGRGFRGRLTGEDGALVDAALDTLAAPRPAQDGTPDPRPAGKRRVDALMDLVRLGLQVQDMPWSGGEPVTMTVVTTAGHLRGCDPTQGAGDSAAVLAGASLEDGTPLSPESTRRLCCDSWLVAAILEPSGAVLDIGRRSRIVPGPRCAEP